MFFISGIHCNFKKHKTVFIAKFREITVRPTLIQRTHRIHGIFDISKTNSTKFVAKNGVFEQNEATDHTYYKRDFSNVFVAF
jgi:hypothetical protein